MTNLWNNIKRYITFLHIKLFHQEPTFKTVNVIFIILSLNNLQESSRQNIQKRSRIKFWLVFRIRTCCNYYPSRGNFTNYFQLLISLSLWVEFCASTDNDMKFRKHTCYFVNFQVRHNCAGYGPVSPVQ